MILEKLTMQNFGPFKEQQEISFPPPNPDRPIILLGGLNGNGKTTILEALQLALYGKLGSFWRNERDTYGQYLTEKIHRNSLSCDGAKVELTFLSDLDGHEVEYRLKRYWKVTRGEARESLLVFVGGVLNKELSELWEEEVQRHLPPRLASLFFFDGEQIERLASVEQSSEVISLGIRTLLGIDLVDTLSRDLNALLRKQGNGRRSEKTKDIELQVKDTRIKELKDQKEALLLDLASIGNGIKQNSQELEKIEELYRQAGGKQFDKRFEIETSLKSLEERETQFNTFLVESASKELPLLLVKDHLKDLLEVGAKESAIREAKTLHKLLGERDEALLSVLSDNNIGLAIKGKVKAFLKKDRLKTSKLAKLGIDIGISKRAVQQLDHLLSSKLEEECDNANKLLVELHKVQDGLVTMSDRLQLVPEPEQLEAVVAERKHLTLEKVKFEQSRVHIENQIHVCEVQLAEKSKALDEALRKIGAKELEENEKLRLMKHVSLVNKTLSEFSKKLLEEHSKKIEQLIMDSYTQLLRKKTLVKSVSIDPHTSKISLVTTGGKDLLPSQLSAGERQLLAIAVLWALARAVGRPLPVVIDTPLGRLDSRHRDKLTEKYFPKASHQVLLLSTDEEIDSELYERLKRRIGKAYHIQFDDVSEASVIKPGYFQEKAHA